MVVPSYGYTQGGEALGGNSVYHGLGCLGIAPVGLAVGRFKGISQIPACAHIGD